MTPDSQTSAAANARLARQAMPGRIIDVPMLSSPLQHSGIGQLFSTASFDIVRLIIPARQQIPTYEAQGEILLHCLEGRVTITSDSDTYELIAGQLLYLPINEPFSLLAVEDTSLLALIVQPHAGSRLELIGERRDPAREASGL